MIVLTGSKGFIGSNFLKALSGKIIEVENNNAWCFMNNFDHWEDVQMIIHQGARSSTTETDIRKIFFDNISFTLFLMEKAIKHGIPIKYASSASVYGNQPDITNPLNQYAISKLSVDYWVMDNIDKFSLVQGFRYFNVYGNGEDNKGDQASPVSKFAKQIAETGRLKLFKGSDKFYRDFICVEDIVSVVLGNTNDSGIFDLGTSLPVSFQHVAECVAKKYDGDIEYIDFPDHLKGKYQDYTCAKNEWGDYRFISVKEYLS